MSSAVTHYTKRLVSYDTTFKKIELQDGDYDDFELSDLSSCLSLYPNVITTLRLAGNQLTDITGVKLVRFVATSSTSKIFDMRYNKIGTATRLALAATLRVNSSLRDIYLNGNQTVDRNLVDAAFIEALRLNPRRPHLSWWRLYSFSSVDADCQRLKDAAEKCAPPSMLEFLLYVHLDTKKIETKIH
ncbi:MAG: hypothetical protein ACOVQN_08960 [Exiguobacterium sp.]